MGFGNGITLSLAAVAGENRPVIKVENELVTAFLKEHVMYDHVCLPKLCYGLEITDINSSCIIELEKFNFHSAKICQGLPASTPNYGALATVGWRTVQGYLDYIRLLFLWRLIDCSL